jgi:hypothetical protein
LVRTKVQPHKYYWHCLTVHEIDMQSSNTSKVYVERENISKLTNA